MFLSVVEFVFISLLILFIIIFFLFLLKIIKLHKENSLLKKITKKNVFIFNKKTLYEEIFKVVKYCSLQKIGMIITFEKNDDLTKKIPSNSGVVIDAPLNSDLLITIFYPGTRLHDGAVIIRKNKIYMANVMFSNKINNKNSFSLSLGSRHRAAIAISEISDSVTLVVSEQTGKISIFKNGLMKLVTINKFINTFSSFMEC